MSTRNKEVWQKLMHYQSTDLVKKAFKDKHGRDLNTGKAREISNIFSQARYYFDAADSSDASIKPLLIYYGVLSLSRGLTLFLFANLRESGLAQSHGLSAIQWGTDLTESNSDVSNLKIKINSRGTFKQLIDATNNISLLRINSSKYNYIHQDALPSADSELILGELLERIPKIREVLVRWKPNRTMFQISEWNNTAANNQTIRIPPSYTEADVFSVMGNDFRGDGQSFSALKTVKFPALSDATGAFNVFGVGNLYAMKQYSFGGGLSKLLTTFVASYSLGMLVRYHPSHWISVLHNFEGNASLPTLLATLDYVENSMPSLILEFLEKRD